ncbi:hypothetical protein QTO30_12370 [Yoonia sp. GPGPB17]|uniref:hypothetical protein n=1 Tax=Yoonia sp. GPGPB17 TaxID=3026147 RepID=UPI0030BB4BED
MRLYLLLLVLASSVLSAPFAFAQNGALGAPELTTSGKAYLDAIARRRIDSDVAYFDPTAAAPALNTQERLATVDEPENNSRSWNGPGEAWPLVWSPRSS